MARAEAVAYGIPKGIRHRHIERAAREINRNGVPLQWKSDRFDVMIGNKSYPPKYIISLATKFAFGSELSSKRFHAHQAIRYLRGLGYKVLDRLLDPQTTIAIEDDESAFPEGRERFRLHRILERDPSISNKAKRKSLVENGTLNCEVCEFDFAETYGQLGEGFIEAHHMTPVAQLNGETKTKVTDLAMVCSNCHRMLHRKQLTVADLRKLVRNIKVRAPVGRERTAVTYQDW